jgi:hypothetical protein
MIADAQGLLIVLIYVPLGGLIVLIGWAIIFGSIATVAAFLQAIKGVLKKVSGKVVNDSIGKRSHA